MTQQITPILQYENVGAAIEWLAKAFGLVEIERERMVDDAGVVWHGSLALGESHVMVSTTPGYEASPSAGSPPIQLYVGVDDARQHYERAQAAGATIVAALEQKFWGDLVYGARDLGGHEWYFGQRVREVDAYQPSDEDVKRHTG